MSARGVVSVALLALVACPTFVRAQPASAGHDVVDPWRSRTRPTPRKMLLDLEDPWAEVGRPNTPLDPWRGKRARGLRGRTLEVIDPWTQEVTSVSRPVPTASFPLLDPWQARAAAVTSRPAPKPAVPTAAFPVVDVVNPW